MQTTQKGSAAGDPNFQAFPPFANSGSSQVSSCWLPISPVQLPPLLERLCLVISSLRQNGRAPWKVASVSSVSLGSLPNPQPSGGSQVLAALAWADTCAAWWRCKDEGLLCRLAQWDRCWSRPTPGWPPFCEFGNPKAWCSCWDRKVLWLQAGPERPPAGPLPVVVQDTIKVKLQTASPGQFTGALDATKGVLQAQGPLGLYKVSSSVCCAGRSAERQRRGNGCFALQELLTNAALAGVAGNGSTAGDSCGL